MVTAQGRYSLLSDSWIQMPSDPPDVDEKCVQDKADRIRRTIDAAIEIDDQERLEALMNRLKAFRDHGLEEDGEWSLENLVYKALRSDGTLNRLKQAALREYDEALSYSCACDDDRPQQYAKSDWIPYQGPKGGKGWQHIHTGRIEYGDEPWSDEDGSGEPDMGSEDFEPEDSGEPDPWDMPSSSPAQPVAQQQPAPKPKDPDLTPAEQAMQPDQPAPQPPPAAPAPPPEPAPPEAPEPPQPTAEASGAEPAPQPKPSSWADKAFRTVGMAGRMDTKANRPTWTSETAQQTGKPTAAPTAAPTDTPPAEHPDAKRANSLPDGSQLFGYTKESPKGLGMSVWTREDDALTTNQLLQQHQEPEHREELDSALQSHQEQAAAAGPEQSTGPTHRDYTDEESASVHSASAIFGIAPGDVGERRQMENFLLRTARNVGFNPSSVPGDRTDKTVASANYLLSKRPHLQSMIDMARGYGWGGGSGRELAHSARHAGLYLVKAAAQRGHDPEGNTEAEHIAGAISYLRDHEQKSQQSQHDRSQAVTQSLQNLFKQVTSQAKDYLSGRRKVTPMDIAIAAIGFYVGYRLVRRFQRRRRRR